MIYCICDCLAVHDFLDWQRLSVKPAMWCEIILLLSVCMSPVNCPSCPGLLLPRPIISNATPRHIHLVTGYHYSCRGLNEDILSKFMCTLCSLHVHLKGGQVPKPHLGQGQVQGPSINMFTVYVNRFCGWHSIICPVTSKTMLYYLSH